MKCEGVLASEHSDHQAGLPPAPIEQSTARRAGILASQLAILATTSFSAALLPPKITLQRTQPSRHRHLHSRSGQCASRAYSGKHASPANIKCPARPVRTRSYSHHGLIHLHHFQHTRGTPFKAGLTSVYPPSSGKTTKTLWATPPGAQKGFGCWVQSFKSLEFRAQFRALTRRIPRRGFYNVANPSDEVPKARSVLGSPAQGRGKEEDVIIHRPLQASVIMGRVRGTA